MNNKVSSEQFAVLCGKIEEKISLAKTRTEEQNAIILHLLAKEVAFQTNAANETLGLNEKAMKVEEVTEWLYKDPKQVLKSAEEKMDELFYYEKLSVLPQRLTFDEVAIMEPSYREVLFFTGQKELLEMFGRKIDEKATSMELSIEGDHVEVSPTAIVDGVSTDYDWEEVYLPPVVIEALKKMAETTEFSWDDIFKRAEGAACGDDSLKAKDHARFEVVGFVEENFGFNLEREAELDVVESVEEMIDNYAERFNFVFDKDGNLKSHSQVEILDRVNELIFYHDELPDRDDKEFESLDIALDLLKDIADAMKKNNN